jgi:hypothetical protein
VTKIAVSVILLPKEFISLVTNHWLAEGEVFILGQTYLTLPWQQIIQNQEQL